MLLRILDTKCYNMGSHIDIYIKINFDNDYNEQTTVLTYKYQGRQDSYSIDKFLTKQLNIWVDELIQKNKLHIDRLQKEIDYLKHIIY